MTSVFTSLQCVQGMMDVVPERPWVVDKVSILYFNERVVQKPRRRPGKLSMKEDMSGITLGWLFEEFKTRQEDPIHFAIVCKVESFFE